MELTNATTAMPVTNPNIPASTKGPLKATTKSRAGSKIFISGWESSSSDDSTLALAVPDWLVSPIGPLVGGAILLGGIILAEVGRSDRRRRRQSLGCWFAWFPWF
tara:strand:- start:946 stop:1260 length:315 start_codon:yes stop_codon:yes gene_type:complete